MGCRRHGERERQSDADYPNPNHLGALSLSCRMVQEKPRADTNYQSSLRILLSLPSTEYRSRVPQLQALAAITDGINSCTNSTESRSAPNPGLWHLSRNSSIRCSPATARDARRGGSHPNSGLPAASMYPLFDYLARSCVITPGAAREGGQNLPRTDLPDHRRITGSPKAILARPRTS